jgi:hypothetical protein
VSRAAFENIRRWREHPVAFVREVFQVEPDAWQTDVLEAFPHQQRVALAACKGPGKTCVLAWLAWNFLLTRPHANIAATSITADNLSDGLWKEMAKWQGKSPLLMHAFEWQKTKILAKDHPETWFMSARSWPKGGTAQQQADTLAGLHADYVMFILDESGGIPDSVMVAADAALSSCVEGHVLQAGNPTHLEGPLYRACTTERRLWHVVNITGDPDDPKRSPRVSVQWAQDMIERWGRDNPYVLVNVFGRFPPGSLTSLIGPDDVSDAMRRSYQSGDIAHAPRILGVDVARFGDDSSVIYPRQGLVAFTPLQYRNLRSDAGAGAVARKWADWDADACFVDDTGGYGAGWIDGLLQLGRSPVSVQFSGVANDARYFNKRTEMYFELVEWIRRGGQLPPRDALGSAELLAALTQTTYSFRGDKMLLEPKDMVKARIGISPDFADALALTFAQPVTPKGVTTRGRARHLVDYDPFSGDAWNGTAMRTALGRQDYDPFA